MKQLTVPAGLDPAEPVAPAEPAVMDTTVDRVEDGAADASFFRALEGDGVYLNPEQLAAVRHTDGPALVLAGAGSGKTRVLTVRCAYLIHEHHVSPEQIMLLTFTRKAADEMSERLGRIPGISREAAGRVTAGTFHSVFLRLLRFRGNHETIITSERQKQVALKVLMKQQGLKDDYEPEVLLHELSNLKNCLQTIHDLPERTTQDKQKKSLLLAYEDWKAERQLIDFDDILVNAYQLLQTDDALREKMQRRFRYILCDEFQDTNPLQYQIVQLIAAPDNHLFCAGDDDQTIYSFNSADSAIMLNFTTDYPEAVRLPLLINYRSDARILGLANQVIAKNQYRHVKSLQAAGAPASLPVFLQPGSVQEEAEKVHQLIYELTAAGTSFQEIAILHRTANTARALFEELTFSEVPFTSYSQTETFYEQSYVKPVVDHLRLALNDDDEAALSGILPSLYIAKDTSVPNVTSDGLLQSLPLLPQLKAFQKTKVEKRVELIKKAASRAPEAAVKLIREPYEAYLTADGSGETTADQAMVRETLDELETSAKRFKTIAAFIEYIDELTRRTEMVRERSQSVTDGVKLMTIHKAKGLEFPVVIVLGASENLLPHHTALEACADRTYAQGAAGQARPSQQKLALEEERRLMYVAVTRAAKQLYVSSPAQVHGKPAGVSRFLLEAYQTTGATEADAPAKSEPVYETKERLVWDCANRNCHAWQQIKSEAEEEKQCPLCGSLMKKAVKEVPLRTANA
ncbi:DNA helicase-2/ATP-dependent DNA helicase PcrA [Salsuginibacillus halophilus]|uniref:DNA 3'-5' helicase n=1 Tax=Salsuginibacillus halophilus TaxID=517424 RepID=A0A2P8HQJ6_9BACI|nr:UvrD-helicase domain-containing protein [Salsuginibacillus halophilus]PSL48493.1 DNA helicase-2/ATP-dependent DNA helicase PcrA [Salsuginibacillus halophilus]